MKRPDQLTFLRYVAALIVVLFHYGRDQLGPSGFLVSGPQMVTFFFVLSGFVLAYAYDKKKICYRSFIVARLARIGPVYWAAGVLSIVVLFGLEYSLSIKSIFLHFSLMQSWIPGQALKVNPPGWSLSVEFFFYLLFPILIIWLKPYGYYKVRLIFYGVAVWGIVTMAAGIILNSGLYESHRQIVHHLLWYFPLTHLISFVLGIMVGFAYVGGARHRNHSGLAVLVIAVVVVVLEWVPSAELALGVRVPAASTFYSLLFAWLVFVIATDNSWVSNILKWQPFRVLGATSYSLYILQVPVYLLLMEVVNLPARIGQLWAFWGYLLLLTILSVATYYVFEIPAQRRIRYYFMGVRR